MGSTAQRQNENIGQYFKENLSQLCFGYSETCNISVRTQTFYLLYHNCCVCTGYITYFGVRQFSMTNITLPVQFCPFINVYDPTSLFAIISIIYTQRIHINVCNTVNTCSRSHASTCFSVKH
jgi:hypothetical protein